MKSWQDILESGRFHLIEDPISSSYIEISQYQEVYGTLLRTLDGLSYDSTVWFFFEVSRVNSTLLVFHNENVRELFIEEALELDLIPKLKEIQEGESAQDKHSRQLEENILFKSFGQNQTDLWNGIPEDEKQEDKKQF